MSHKVETMAYNQAETPWHGLGVPVPHDLTPAQMLEAAELNWEVVKVPTTYPWKGKDLNSGWSALIRAPDGSKLNVVPNDWNTVQNSIAFEFFNDWCAAGEINMETAGSLEGGRLVWALAKLNESFELPGHDQVNGYILFTNPHKYGWSTSVSLTPIRVVCWNTLTLSLGTTSKDKIIKVTHRNAFKGDQVKETLGVAKDKLGKYKEMAEFLTSKRASNEDIVTYFKRVFPVLSTNNAPRKEMSKSAKTCLDTLLTQPGAEMSAGTWWPPFNSVTHYLDHLAGRTQDTRLTGAWYGEARKTKVKALETAVQMATAA